LKLKDKEDCLHGNTTLAETLVMNVYKVGEEDKTQAK